MYILTQVQGLCLVVVFKWFSLCVFVCEPFTGNITDTELMSRTPTTIFHWQISLKAIPALICGNILPVQNLRIQNTVSYLIIIDRFYIALFSTFEQTHCAHV